jgi:NTE family protein
MRIDSVGGTSIGAIIGAGVAADWSDEEMLEKYRKAFVDGRPLRDYTLPFVSLVTGRRVARLLREAFGARDIEDLALPYYCVSANLSVGKVHVHRSGPIWLWLRASSAIPGILPPVFHRSEVYVDGAVMNNLPTDIMRQQAVGEIVAVDISADDVLRADVEEYALPSMWRMFVDKMHRPRRPGILSILLRSGMVNAEAATSNGAPTRPCCWRRRYRISNCSTGTPSSAQSGRLSACLRSYRHAGAPREAA